MRLERFADIGAFAARVEPYLLEHEATHCLMLGLLSTLSREPVSDADLPYMALVEERGKIVLAAMRTPPFNLILSLVAPEFSSDPTEALALVADDAWTRYQGSLSGVIAPIPVSRLFAEQWEQQTGQSVRLAVEERVYELQAVIPVKNVAGSYRRPTETDRDLLIRWLAAFAEEALGPLEQVDAAQWVESYFTSATRSGYLWEDGDVPVCFVSYGNPTAHGIRIGPVYTPPKHRGRGYARACVAVTSQYLLDTGRTFCFLFTDLANPTSNHIYQMVGYNPVNDVEIYLFKTES